MKRIIFLPAIAALLCGACSSAVPEDYTQYVDPYIGTGDHGHVFMGANVPFGFVQLGPTSIPQTWDWCSGYNYADTTVIGFGHTHLSGTGIGDLNDISLMPVVGKVTPGRGTAGDPSSGMWSRFSRADERCAPGYYATRLLRYGIGVELTASPRVGMSRYAFPASDDAGIVLDLENGQGWDRSTDCGITACSDRTVEGWRYSTGWADDQRVYFHAEFSKPFERIVFTGADTLSADGRSARGRKLYGRFGFRTEENERITVKVGLSAVSAENARRNMQAECPGWDFEAVREATRRAWNGELSKIRIETADPAVRRIFYTALYHTMIAPSLFCDVNGDYRGADGAVRRDTTFTNYTTFSLWDTYRAAHPLLTLIHPEKIGDLINTMLRIHEQQGKLPVWHLMGCETDCMVGNPAIPVVADALLKGFGGFDRAKAYEAMKSSAMRDDRGWTSTRGTDIFPMSSTNRSDTVSNTPSRTGHWRRPRSAKANGRITTISSPAARPTAIISTPRPGLSAADRRRAHGARLSIRSTRATWSRTTPKATHGSTHGSCRTTSKDSWSASAAGNASSGSSTRCSSPKATWARTLRPTYRG